MTSQWVRTQTDLASELRNLGPPSIRSRSHHCPICDGCHPVCSSSTKDRALTACQSLSEQLTLSECTFQSLFGTCFPVTCIHCSSSALWNTQNKSSLSFHRIQGPRAFSSPGETPSGPLTVPKGHGFPHPTNPPFINVPVEMNAQVLGCVWPEVMA